MSSSQREAEILQRLNAADPYGTLVGYFNSMRALGGAKRLVEDDVKLVRLRYLAQQRGLPRVISPTPEELDEPARFVENSGAAQAAGQPISARESDWPVDVLSGDQHDLCRRRHRPARADGGDRPAEDDGGIHSGDQPRRPQAPGLSESRCVELDGGTRPLALRAI